MPLVSSKTGSPSAASTFRRRKLKKSKCLTRYRVKLNEQEQKLMEIAKRKYGQFHVATKWYFRGWDPLDYQYVWHHIPVGNTTTVAGIASGKTTMVSASYAMDCMTYPGFRALNASVTAKQAELSYQMVM